MLIFSAFFVLRFALSLIFFRNTPEGAKAFAWRGAMCEYAGIYEKAERYYREAALITSKFNTKGSNRLHWLQTLNLGVVQRSNGNLEKAKHTLERVARESESLEMTYVRLLALQQLSLLHQELGDAEGTRQYVEQMDAVISSARRHNESYLRNLTGTGWTSPAPLRNVLPYRMLMIDMDLDRKIWQTGSLRVPFLVAVNICEVGLAFSIFLGTIGEYVTRAVRNLRIVKQELARLQRTTEALDGREDSMGAGAPDPSWLRMRRALSGRPSRLNAYRLQRLAHRPRRVENRQNSSRKRETAKVATDRYPHPIDGVAFGIVASFSGARTGSKSGSVPYGDKLSRILPAHETIARLLAQDGRRSLDNGNLIEAKDYCLCALNMAMARPNLAGDDVVYYHLGEVCRAMSETDLAFDNFCRAIKCIENMRRGVLAEDLKLSFLGTRTKMYEDAVLAALEIDVSKAFEIAERARSRAFLDILGEHAASLQPRKAPEREAAHLRRLREEMRSVEKQCDELHTIMLGQRSWERFVTILRQVNMVRQLRRSRGAYERLHRRLQAQDEEWASFFRVIPITADEARRNVGTGTVLLEYYITDSKTVVFSLSEGRGPIAIRLDISRRELETEVDKFISGRSADVLARIRRGDPSISEETKIVLRSLYGLLVGPLEQQLDGASKLVIIPHGILHHVPFHALYNNGRYLVDDFEVSYAPSTSVLQFCRKKARLQKKSCLIIADPRGDLEYAREEALNVSQHFEHVVVLPSNGESATVNNVKQKMPNFDVIHFACHGKFDSDAPMASFLELSATVGELGLLTVDRLYELQLNCSLVTLSACETGVSKVLSGDELIGLVRGFLFAGAPSLLVSLWSVDDQSTSELMTRFYEGYISNGESKSAALRQSMLRVKTNESTSHPYFWAPFCLIGEGT